MCKVIRIGIICGGEQDHECDEKAIMYETTSGERFFFTDVTEERRWYNEHYQRVIAGSVACSICQRAEIDNAWKL